MLKGLFKFVLAIAVAAVVAVGGINACVVLSANPAITTLDKYEQSRVASCDAIVVLGASVLPDGSLSPILQKRVVVQTSRGILHPAPADSVFEYLLETRFPGNRYRMTPGRPTKYLYVFRRRHHLVELHSSAFGLF